ncbi:hypothetical protein [Nocardia jejuensis]|uniref:hypothetical protein n=1 Tax=Nocardia jejuensis TaxID=328049 RepID=UPI00082BD2E9|nr:hypothetical protein [Nocardia jejuensis]
MTHLARARVCLPIYPELSDLEIERIMGAVGALGEWCGCARNLEPRGLIVTGDRFAIAVFRA